MPPPRNLRAFLALARKSLTAPAAQRQAPLTFVVGNESADLDSLCSAVVFAYLRSHTQPKCTLHIPLANIPREDLPLRPELSKALSYAGVGVEDLLTLSDLEEVVKAHGLEPQDTRWLLVDHNALTGTLAERFASRVVGCVDHHEDEGVVSQETGDEPRVLRKTGSCMSLVLEYCHDAWEALSKTSGHEDGGGDLDSQLARVALAPILIDTNNLKSKAKTTPTDVKIAELLEAKIGDKESFDRKKYHKKLSKLKEDISQFSYRDNFRKDFKSWTEAGLVLGTSSVPQGFKYMLENIGDKESLLREFRAFAQDKKLDIAAIMTSSAKDDGVFKRNLLVWGLNEKAVRAVERFVEAQKENLGLEPFHHIDLSGGDGQHEVRYCWNQHQTGNSRKQLAPMLRSAMAEAAKL
ncbi:exopolyphosphatase-like protein [Diaporthe eres]|uniref:DHHA2 domain-containing protein n=1 Tax=Diaporthe vaccinii TaxID=105482 RepID=A0ABR4EF77_9PEZI|nr:exopolyphosphatase-like protein [Diaporthe eres]